MIFKANGLDGLAGLGRDGWLGDGLGKEDFFALKEVGMVGLVR